MSINKIKTQPTKHYWKKPKNFKNTAYHLHTTSIICKIKLKSANRNECKKQEEATTCTLLIREI